MKYLESYSNYKVNEELTRNQRILLHLPYLLMGALGRKMGITTMLNYKWGEIKKKTKDSKFDPILARSGSEVSKMKRNLKKISINDLPENKLGFATFLRKWNLYLVEGDKHQDIYPNDRSRSDLYKRPIVYISKDEIQTGDSYMGERISDREIYDQFKNSKKMGKEYPDNLTELPIIVMIAKVDFAEESKDIEQYIDDICLDLEDELPVEAKPRVYETGDKIFIDISINDGHDVVYNEELSSRIKMISESIKSYLKSTLYEFESEIFYSIKDQLTYYGNDGRFDKVRKLLKEYDRIWNRDDDSGYVNKADGININQINGIHVNVSRDTDGIKKGRYYIRLVDDDLSILNKDIQNCSTTLIKNWQADSIKKAKNGQRGPIPDSIKIKKITISLNKKN
jgi:hypothetical protein